MVSIRTFRLGLLLWTSTLYASTVTISDTSTFSSLTSASLFSAPDEPWGFSFTVNSTPAVSNVNPGNYFDVAFSDFKYSLNGTPVAIVPADIRFFNLSQFGLFEICFTAPCYLFNNPANGFAFVGSQMYTGSESAPTMLTGTFTPSYAYAFVNVNQFFQSPNQTILAVSTPEPSYLAAFGTSLLCLFVRRFRRRR